MAFEHLTGVGWEDSWGSDNSQIKKVTNANEVSNGVIDELFTLFDFKRFIEILFRLLALNFVFVILMRIKGRCIG